MEALELAEVLVSIKLDVFELLLDPFAELMELGVAALAFFVKDVCPGKQLTDAFDHLEVLLVHNVSNKHQGEELFLKPFVNDTEDGLAAASSNDSQGAPVILVQPELYIVEVADEL